ncbi:MAG: hypothetical protein CFE31_08010 [Rhizobiales bacterium PAR1]|nr:MAG: hypothetical protein CFE31_08010 [Rhizobiales bacterium PAR1]
MGHRGADQFWNVEGAMPGLLARACGGFATQRASFPQDAKTTSPAQTCLIDAPVAAPIRSCKAHGTGFVPDALEIHASAFARSLMGSALMGSNGRSQGEAEMQDHDDR